MTTPEEKLAAEMYPETDSRGATLGDPWFYIAHRERYAFLHGLRLGKDEGDAEGYARAIEACIAAVKAAAVPYVGHPETRGEHGDTVAFSFDQAIAAIRALSPTSPASTEYSDRELREIAKLQEVSREADKSMERLRESLGSPAPGAGERAELKLYDRATSPDGTRGQIRSIQGTSAYLLPDGGTIGQWFELKELGEALPYTRDDLGRMVREAWVKWAKTQPNPKPSWLLPYDELAECDKEADRQIGDHLRRSLAAAPDKEG